MFLKQFWPKGVAFTRDTQNIKHNSEILLSAVEYAADNIMVTDIDGTILYVNHAFEETTGYSKKEAKGQNPRILQSGKHGQEYYSELWTTILKGKVFRAKTTNKTKNGTLYISDQTITPIKDPEGNISCFVSIWKDITEQVKAEEEVQQLKTKLENENLKLVEVLSIEQHLNTILDLNRLIDYVVDKTAKVLESDRCSVMFVDHNAGDLCMKGCKGIKDEAAMQERPKLGDPIAGLVAQEGKSVLVRDIETDKRFPRKNRPSYCSKSFVSAPIKLGDSLIGVISVSDKISQVDKIFTEIDLRILNMIVRQVAIAIENAKLYRQLNYLAITDPMTNMYNYRHFAKSLDHEISRLKRYPSDLCLLLIDVDDFKSYNDAFGHIEGDKLLQGVGEVLDKNLREIDTACRYAGDEFVVILPGTGKEESKKVAQKIKENFQQFDLKRKVTLSIGIAQHQGTADRADLVLKADTALYDAKNAGKDSVRVY